MSTLTKKFAPEEFAFDFDGVVGQTMELFLAIGKEEFGLPEIPVSAIKAYDLRQFVGAPAEILLEMIMKVMEPEYTRRIQPVPGVAEFLGKLAQKNTPLLCITARPDAESTKLWFSEILGFDESVCEVIATGNFNAKADVLKERGKRLFIEDRLETCFHLEKEGISPIIYARPWNRQPHSFREVSSWAEVGAFLDL
ncbi:haloacid dehalogenase [Desulfococcaceae bacterium OttesenSCG-928-F15]|nr:haloacid dehalogenase [Desulfococcaceae bacterium OttesenSCG-928-F15]